MMRRIATCMLALAGACTMAAPNAQVPENPRFRLLGSRHGLPTTVVNALERDRLGFVWVATSDGLARYDGHGFRVWRHDAADPRSISGNTVQAIHVDARDRVWTSSEFGGIDMLDAARAGFHHWRSADYPQLRTDDIFAFASQGDRLWIGTGGGGMYGMDLAGKPSDWVPTPVPGVLPSDVVMDIAIEKDGRVCVATTGGLAVLESGRLRGEPLPGAVPMPMVYELWVDGASLWAGTSAGIFRREAGGHWRRLPYADMFERPNAATSFARDLDGSMWIGSQRGLWRVTGDSARPYPVKSDSAWPREGIDAMMGEPEGGLWVAASGVGVGHLPSDWRSLAVIRRDGETRGAHHYGVVASARAGGIWLGGAQGHIERVDAQGVAEVVDADVRRRLPERMPFFMTEDAHGQLWLGYGRDGLWRLGRDGRLDSWRRVTDRHAPPAESYDHIAPTRDGKVWLALSGKGLELRDAVTGRLLRQFPLAGDDVGDGEILDMRMGPDERLWVAGSFGLGWLDETSGRLVMPSGLRGRRVHVFDFIDGDALWLHAADGLSRHNRGKDEWRRTDGLPAGRELPSLKPGSLRVDARGRVWLSSQRGLLRWDPRTAHMARFGVDQGFDSQEFVDGGMTVDDRGTLAAVAYDGSVVLVDTRYPDPPTRVPTLRIDGIDVRRDGEWASMPLTGALEFGPEEREFRLTGNLLAFDDPAGTRYWSRLEGFDNGWVDQGAQGERVFSGLAPGNYRLRMRAMDAAGHPAREQQLAFRVRPPWWRTWTAVWCYILIAGGLLAWAAIDYRRRVARAHALALAEQKRTLAEQTSEAKTRFLATLGHEIRTPMTGVLGMAELLQSTPLDAGQRGQVDAILRAGSHLLRLLNDALDLARIEADKLVLAEEPFDLQPLVEEAQGLMKPLAMRKGLSFVVTRAPGLPHGCVGDRMRIGQILFNLLGNAIKFTETGEVGLAVEPNPGGGVRFVIHDTGPGLNEAQRKRLFRRFEQAEGARTSARYGGSGLGLAICQELAAAMGGRIDIDSAPGAGARFSVVLPLREAPREAGGQPASMPAVPASMHLLLVEDDATVAEVVTGLLHGLGHAVRHVPHGLAALAEAASSRFDAALLDLDLPGIDGFVLARQLRINGFDGPLLAVTARADTEAERRAREAGFDTFLRKPVSAVMLSDGLREAAQARARAKVG